MQENFCYENFFSKGIGIFIGNIFDSNFKILEKVSICNCYKYVENERAFLLVKGDD